MEILAATIVTTTAATTTAATTIAATTIAATTIAATTIASMIASKSAPRARRKFASHGVLVSWMLPDRISSPMIISAAFFTSWVEAAWTRYARAQSPLVAAPLVVARDGAPAGVPRLAHRLSQTETDRAASDVMIPRCIRKPVYWLSIWCAARAQSKNPCLEFLEGRDTTLKRFETIPSLDVVYK